MIFGNPCKALGNMLDGENVQHADVTHKIGKGWAKVNEIRKQLRCKQAAKAARADTFNVHVTGAILRSAETITLEHDALMRLHVASISMLPSVFSGTRGDKYIHQYLVDCRRSARAILQTSARLRNTGDMRGTLHGMRVC